MMNIVLGLVAVILGIIVLTIAAQLVVAFMLWRSRKKIAKNGFDMANELLETVNDAFDEINKDKEEDKTIPFPSIEDEFVMFDEE